MKYFNDMKNKVREYSIVGIVVTGLAVGVLTGGSNPNEHTNKFDLYSQQLSASGHVIEKNQESDSTKYNSVSGTLSNVDDKRKNLEEFQHHLVGPNSKYHGITGGSHNPITHAVGTTGELANPVTHAVGTIDGQVNPLTGAVGTTGEFNDEEEATLIVGGETQTIKEGESKEIIDGVEISVLRVNHIDPLITLSRPELKSTVEIGYNTFVNGQASNKVLLKQGEDVQIDVGGKRYDVSLIITYDELVNPVTHAVGTTGELANPVTHAVGTTSELFNHIYELLDPVTYTVGRTGVLVRSPKYEQGTTCESVNSPTQVCVNVLSVSYIPESPTFLHPERVQNIENHDHGFLDSKFIDGGKKSVTDVESHIKNLNREAVNALEEGSAYKKFNNQSAINFLDFEIIEKYYSL